MNTMLRREATHLPQTWPLRIVIARGWYHALYAAPSTPIT
jgi:hypothetical protein